MKKITALLAACCLAAVSLQAQQDGTGADTSARLSTISLAVIMPDNIEGLQESSLSILESKITSLVSDNGVGATGYSQNFVIYPRFQIFSVKQTAGGMRSITVADCNINLQIKQVSTGTIFSSYNKSLQGSGFSRDEAINNALQQVKPDDVAASNFINSAKNKIIAYYNQNCGVMMQKADKETIQHQYEAAMGILLSIPEEAAGCYSTAQAKATQTFAQMQQFNCKKYLQDAQAFAAKNDYQSALQRLSWIDPTVNCGGEAKTLLNTIAKEVDEDKKKEWDLLFKIYDGKIEVAKARAQAMNSLATAWLLNQPKLVSYNEIMR